MKEALAEARKAFQKGEVPVGAVVVYKGKIIGRGHNLREKKSDPTAHAEIIAIKKAARHLGTWRLTGTTIYVTIEPCPMCAGAMVNARVQILVFGTPDPKAGAAGTLMNILQDERLNHRVEVSSGVLAEECRSLIQGFFRGLRT